MSEKSIIEKLGITPGPWNAQRGQEENPETMVYVCHPKTECDETTVCNFDETDYRENHLSNARLIAAAPEMLEALIEEVLFIEKNTVSTLHGEGDPYEKMKAIIEKACHPKTWEKIKELI